MLITISKSSPILILNSIKKSKVKGVFVGQANKSLCFAYILMLDQVKITRYFGAI
jgi:hypothetical protein